MSSFSFDRLHSCIFSLLLLPPTRTIPSEWNKWIPSRNWSRAWLVKQTTRMGLPVLFQALMLCKRTLAICKILLFVRMAMFCIFTQGAIRNQFLSHHLVESSMFYVPWMVKTSHKWSWVSSRVFYLFWDRLSTEEDQWRTCRHSFSLTLFIKPICSINIIQITDISKTLTGREDKERLMLPF